MSTVLATTASVMQGIPVSNGSGKEGILSVLGSAWDAREMLMSTSTF